MAADQKFSRLTLTAMVVGSMVGAGIFSLPARFGTATGLFGAMIAWIIAGGGTLMLAFAFQSLAMRRPDLDAGIYKFHPSFADANVQLVCLSPGVVVAYRQRTSRSASIVVGLKPDPQRTR